MEFLLRFQTPMEVDKAPAATPATDSDKTPASVTQSDKDKTPASLAASQKDKTTTPLTHLEKDKDKPAEKNKDVEKEKRSDKEQDKERERDKDRDKLKMSGSLSLKKHHGKVGRGRPRKVDKEAREAMMTAALAHTVPVSLDSVYSLVTTGRLSNNQGQV